MKREKKLRRVITLPALIFYGTGTIIGAGIYVLIGEVSAIARQWMPVSFLLSGMIASFTGLSYCELSARYPKSAGEVVYVNSNFNSSILSKIVGYMVLLIGTISSATIARGFVGYAEQFITLPSGFIISLFVIVLTAIAVWGILESVKLAVVITLIEIAGLFAVIGVGGMQMNLTDYSFEFSSLSWSAVPNIFAGAFLAFYAYIGFEDMINLAEETKDTKVVMPKAIIWSLIISITLYLLVTTVLVLAVPIEQLSTTKTPLILVFEPFGAYGILAISIIAMIATINGALVQIIMSSRILYGMANMGLSWKKFAMINSTTKTPMIGTIFVGSLILCFALWLPLITLARMTSIITLAVFILVNASLIIAKRKKSSYDGISFPVCIPILGVLASFLLMFSYFF